MRLALFAVLLGLGMSAAAADRNSKIQKLMEVQGLLQMWDQQMAQSQQQGREQAQKMLDQVLASLNPPPKFDARFRDTAEEYMEAVQTSWTAEDVVNVWAQKYGSRFSDQELDGLLAYYTSPLGRKDIAATQAAMPEFMEHFQQLSRPIAEKAFQNYLENLKRVVTECRCKK